MRLMKELVMQPKRWCEVHLIQASREEDQCLVAQYLSEPVECCMVEGWWIIREVCD